MNNPEQSQNWIKKQDDSEIAIEKSEHSSDSPADLVSFHSAQCAEKYLKEFLIFYCDRIPGSN